MTDKQMKIHLLILIFALFCLDGYAQRDTLSFLHITDSHMMFNLENYNKDIVLHREYTKDFKEGNNRFRQFMETTPLQTGADMIIVTGDMIDFYDAETAGGDALAYQIEQFARFLGQFDYPLYMTLGNHDVFSYNWGKGRVVPNQLKTGAARASWIRTFDCFRDGTYYSRIYQIGETTYRLIFLDNAYYQFKKAENVVNPYIDKPQLHWLKAELNASQEDVEIILMHVPFTEQSALPESNNELYAALTSVPSVRLILAGHYHKGTVMEFPVSGDNKITQVGTDALVGGSENWRLIRLTEEEIQVSLIGREEDEVKISSNINDYDTRN
ncbi:MAG: metallophosphoesterase [Proteiniphilum sp.]|nr:metallophosphoesterase [Proteiniphilum sp.]